MQKDNKLFEDLARLATGAAGSMVEMGREFERMVASQMEKLLLKMNLVSREEFDTMRDMLAKSRMEQEEMKKRLDALEKKR